jgi:hypothetical protein
MKSRFEGGNTIGLTSSGPDRIVSWKSHPGSGIQLNHIGKGVWSMETFTAKLLEMAPALVAIVAFVFALVRTAYGYFKSKDSARRMADYEKRLFEEWPKETENIKSIIAVEVGDEAKRHELAQLVEGGRGETLRLGLSQIFREQIEVYQNETRARASWSFVIALVAMALGLGFIFWGGNYILTSVEWQGIAAGSVVATLGGSVSAYITKTFLDVHKISLEQLNRYFRQPVLNEHILNAQRLADELEDTSRNKAYRDLVNSVITLISSFREGLPATAQPKATA